MVLLPLSEAASLASDKIQNPESLSLHGGVTRDVPVLVILAAGKGTRFGREPKCIQPVRGKPLARHSIDAFRSVSPSPVVCVVGYRHEEVSAVLGRDNIYVRSDNPAGGTAFAALEAFSVGALLERDPLLVVSMGDRVVPSSVFRRMWDTHREGNSEADLTLLTAVYEPPKNRGKGRAVRGENGRLIRIVEERDVAREPDEATREALLELTEGNCPLYLARASTLHRYLRDLTNANAQGQYYLTDIVEAISHHGGDIRTVTTTVTEPEYDLLCSEVTRPADLAVLEGILASNQSLLSAEEPALEDAASAIAADRPGGQVASVARQLEELVDTISRENLGFEPEGPVAIGLSGGRLRIAFMHPDMVRFFGPAWQMPIGAKDEAGGEQIVMLVQEAEDRRIHLYPTNPAFRENVDSLPADHESMYPGDEISDLDRYELFGTGVSEKLLLSLGYLGQEELDELRRKGQPLPPPSAWVSNNMRRPFPLVGNAIASMRTLREGVMGAKVQQSLGRDSFHGLRLVSTGDIPQGGFASSSAVTLATKNAINALYELGIPQTALVDLACQAEYGTGVRAGSLDQATEQMGRAGKGTLISSNPRENYRIIGTFPVPSKRFRIIFPYSVERDRDAWRWSWGAYAEIVEPGRALTAGEIRKLTGRAAELAAILTSQPSDIDFFQPMEGELVSRGALSRESRTRVCDLLRQVPSLVTQAELRQLVEGAELADGALQSLFAGWRDPVLRRTLASGEVVTEVGVPLRAMLAYLFGEVAKNFALLHEPERWIEWVTRSQRGDRSVNIDSDRLPRREQMESDLGWERGRSGPELMNLWLERFGATPFDYNRGLGDDSLSAAEALDLRTLDGSNFFRGLALIDLAEAMLKRAFGPDAVAVRVNAAGQGDYFQVHVDTTLARPDDVKQFVRDAFYRRFGLSPSPDFVELHPGGPAAGVRLDRYDMLPQLIERLRARSLP